MDEENTKSKAQLLRQGIRQVLAMMLATGSTFFLSYGGFDWPQAWVLLAMWAAYYLLMAVYGSRRSPEVVQARVESFDREFQPWDRWILPAYVALSYGLYVICGLDAGRFGWSVVPVWVMWLGFVLVIPVYVVPFWATLSNPFASGTARIHSERGHYAVSTGPYRYVRHPMYAVMIPFAFAFPLFLGSFWAMIPGVLVIVLFVLRTALEDRFLQENLEGYKAYADQVRWRLVPGLW